MKHFRIEETHLPYLHVQCGDIAHLIGDEDAWRKAYDERIERVYQSMLPMLPSECQSILDIGGGLSGIGARLCDHYSGIPVIAVMDGRRRPPVVKKHREPFNNATYTQQFLRINGVKAQEFYEPGDASIASRKYDLVISTQAWPFHIELKEYLAMVLHVLKPDGRLIVDVRNSKHEYFCHLEECFGAAYSLAKAEKWTRMGYIGRGKMYRA